MATAHPYLSTFPLLSRIVSHALPSSPSTTAITDPSHDLSITYPTLLSDVISLASQLIAVVSSSPTSNQLSTPAPQDLREARVAILCNKGYLVPLALLSTWTAGGLAVPILPGLPFPEQAYITTNADCSIIICDSANRQRADALAEEAIKVGTGRNSAVNVTCAVVEINVERIRSVAPEKEKVNSVELVKSLNEIRGERRAMMLYTSGTTGKPKGVVTRHSALASQVSSIVETWRWTHKDNLLHVLPLNHLHGIVVALLSTLWAGASVEMWEKFDAPKIWHRWINAERLAPITMFFGVPTIYSRLIQAHAALPVDVQSIASKASATLRLQVSGSAPLPESVKTNWEKEGGVGGGMTLLERYGMTETGVIASTGWEDELRIKGCVGYALPNIEIRLWDIEKNSVVDSLDVPGEVQVRGPGIFIEYWRLPEATTKEFASASSDDPNQLKWFKTGDVAIRTSEPALAKGQYKILGRNSVDIIQSGGEKLSAVEIERAILELEGIEDVAVVGVEDEEWGQVVAACIVTTRKSLTLDTLQSQLRTSLAAYKLPRKLKLYDAIPRNGMGKVQKKLLVAEAFPVTKKA